MSAQTRQAKVLRIAIIQDGKIVQERLIKAGEPVTVGESAKNAFVFPKTHLPTAEYTLFKPSGNGYVLHFTDRMKGKISSGGAVVQLQKLSSDPSVTKKNGIATLPLTEQDRGKISIDSVTVLFQFVPPPPVQAVKPIQQMDFRPRLLEEDDPVFLGFLGLWSALAVVFAIWAANAEPRDYSLEDIPDRFVKMVVPEKKDVEPPDLELETIDSESFRKVEETESSGQKAMKEAKSDAERAKAESQRKDEIVSQSKLLLKILGTRGESSAGIVENLWSDEEQGLGDIDAALAETSGVATSAADAGLRTGNNGGTGSADIGSLTGVGGGAGGDVSGPKVTVKPKVSAGTGSIDASGDENAVKATVSRNSGQLTYCYEKQMKVVPTLEGRVEIGWTVSGGKVSGSPYIIANSTGDAELANCVIQKIRRWTFPADVEGEMSWPFVFQQKK